MKQIFHVKIAWLLLLILSTVAACKKNAIVKEEQEEIVSPATGTRQQFTLDSIYLYARQVYLWNSVLPTYTAFDPRTTYGSYGSDLIALETELFDLSQLAQNPLTTLSYENPLYAGKAKYSYLVTGKTGAGSVTAAVSSTTTNPVLLTAVLNSGSSTIGYIVLSSFPKLSAAQSYLDAAFAQLTAAKPVDLIVDLRSNGGGYVETAEYVANLVATSNLNGKISFTEQFNSQMQQGKATILRHQPYLDENNQVQLYNGRPATLADVDFSEAGNTYKFSKKGNLETVKNIYFIVSGNTASASELLINCLRPYFNVKLAGSKTYGKPVGFFGVVIDTYTVYLSSFLIKNALGSAAYFEGMEVDIPIEPDGEYSLGDPNEACLKKVLNYIQITATSTLSASGTVRNSIKSYRSETPATSLLPADTVSSAIGMVEHRLRLKN